jgi:peptidyl-prolyl cis-trans isomerase D
VKALIRSLKADQTLEEPLFLNAAGVFDVVKFKEYFKANPAKLNFKDRGCRLERKIKCILP